MCSHATAAMGSGLGSTCRRVRRLAVRLSARKSKQLRTVPRLAKRVLYVNDLGRFDDVGFLSGLWKGEQVPDELLQESCSYGNLPNNRSRNFTMNKAASELVAVGEELYR
jgi:hypothetical protein